MSQIPGARVVRGGKGDGEREPGTEVAPAGLVLRLAPRELPRALVWRLIFGGWIAASGWLLAAIGTVLVLVVLSIPDPSSSLSPTTTGRRDFKILSIEDTGVVRYGGHPDGHRLHRVRSRRIDQAGVETLGEYTIDLPAHSDSVNRRHDEPSEPQLEDTRGNREFGLFLLVFPIAGLALVIWQLPAGLRNLRLLRHGVETRGKLVGKHETRVQVNGVPVMALTFAYDVDGKKYSATVKTRRFHVLEDDEREAMLYDPRSPSRATTLDHLPGSPKVTTDGEIAARPGTAIHLMIAPILFVGLVAAAVIWMI